MASSLLLSPLSSKTIIENRELTASALIYNPKLFFAAKPRKRAFRRCGFKSPEARKSLDHIPKQFREENLKDGLMDNYKNAPQYLYGLTPSLMDMFMKEDSPLRRQSEKVTEETISSANSYMNNCGIWTMSEMNERVASKYSRSVSMYRRGPGRYGRTRTPPPDFPSLVLNDRIVYLGMPLVPAVTKLIVSQFMWLDYENQTEPIHLYINSTGTQNDNGEIIGSEFDAYTIACCMAYCKADVYTLNFGVAFGQAAMLLSLGTKGRRGLVHSSSTSLYLPKVDRSSGAATDMWIKAKELDTCKENYVELLAMGIGKPKEEIEKDLQFSKFFTAQDAIDYGIADKIFKSRERNCEEFLAQSKAKRRGAGGVGRTSGPLLVNSSSI